MFEEGFGGFFDDDDVPKKHAAKSKPPLRKIISDSFNEVVISKMGVQILDTTTETHPTFIPYATLKGAKATVACATFSRDGTKIVCASWDQTLRLYLAETGERIGEDMKKHPSDVNYC